MSGGLKVHAACYLAWWACLHFAPEVLVLLFAVMGSATEGWFRFLLETYCQLALVPAYFDRFAADFWTNLCFELSFSGVAPTLSSGLQARSI